MTNSHRINHLFSYIFIFHEIVSFDYFEKLKHYQWNVTSWHSQLSHRSQIGIGWRYWPFKWVSLEPPTTKCRTIKCLKLISQWRSLIENKIQTKVGIFFSQGVKVCPSPYESLWSQESFLQVQHQKPTWAQ